MALQLSPHMTVMQNAVQKASRRLLRDFAEVEQLQVSVKGPGDFVSQADLRSEQMLGRGADQVSPRLCVPAGGRRRARQPELELALDHRSVGRHHQLPARRAALVHQRGAGAAYGGWQARWSRRSSPGCVYNPVTDEMFWAEKGSGAFLNERRLRVSARREIKDALFATGIPFAAVAPQRRLAFARTLGVLMPQVAGIRRFGAAALDLAWVAAGRYDGYWELGLRPWDMAAGALIVREAGGFATDVAGSELVLADSGVDVVAANPALHPRLLEVVAEGVAAATRTA